MPMTPDQKEAAEKAYAEDPGIGRRRLVAKAHCTDFAASTFLKQKHRASGSPSTGTPARGVTVREFCGRFDFEAKLTRTIKELCRDRFVAEADIREQCDIPIPAFRTVADLPQFKSCQIRDGGVTYWSTKENVDAARQQARKWGLNR